MSLCVSQTGTSQLTAAEIGSNPIVTLNWINGRKWMGGKFRLTRCNFIGALALYVARSISKKV